MLDLQSQSWKHDPYLMINVPWAMAILDITEQMWLVENFLLKQNPIQDLTINADNTISHCSATSVDKTPLKSKFLKYFLNILHNLFQLSCWYALTARDEKTVATHQFLEQHSSFPLLKPHNFEIILQNSRYKRPCEFKNYTPYTDKLI